MIGSRVSKVCCSLVLAAAETRWSDDSDMRASHGYKPSIAWEDTVATIRYVDDILLASPVFCSQCLAEAVNIWAPVPFDVSMHGVHVTWTDMDISMPLGMHETLTIDVHVKPSPMPP